MQKSQESADRPSFLCFPGKQGILESAESRRTVCAFMAFLHEQKPRKARCLKARKAWTVEGAARHQIYPILTIWQCCCTSAFEFIFKTPHTSKLISQESADRPSFLCFPGKQGILESAESRRTVCAFMAFLHEQKPRKARCLKTRKAWTVEGAARHQIYPILTIWQCCCTSAFEFIFKTPHTSKLIRTH